MRRKSYPLLLLVVFAVACGSSVAKTNTDTKTERTFSYPFAAVEAVVPDALRAHGFEITGKEAGYFTGHRPNQMGLFVGSGGENVGVWITQLGPQQTKVGVVTKLTMVGVVGQRSWDAEVLKAIEDRLHAAAASR